MLAKNQIVIQHIRCDDKRVRRFFFFSQFIPSACKITRENINRAETKTRGLVPSLK